MGDTSESEEDYHLRNWKEHRNGDSLSWLFEEKIGGDVSLVNRARILEILGSPDPDSSNDEWNYSAQDDNTLLVLYWDPQDLDRLKTWQMP